MAGTSHTTLSGDPSSRRSLPPPLLRRQPSPTQHPNLPSPPHHHHFLPLSFVFVIVVPSFYVPSPPLSPSLPTLPSGLLLLYLLPSLTLLLFLYHILYVLPSYSSSLVVPGGYPEMSRTICPTLVMLAALLALTAAQGFYTQRYGKRSDTGEVTVRSGFYANRNGRSSPSQGLPEIKIRSSRFIGGSRYGKRSGPAPAAEPEFTPVMNGEGEAFVCLFVCLSLTTVTCPRRSLWVTPLSVSWSTYLTSTAASAGNPQLMKRLTEAPTPAFVSVREGTGTPYKM
ncbi:putative ryamide-like [Homarus americanus]|uniref:Putative ryamide-like n=1 Tax=Homarus americanus TaxID=6706 RepID=A0A8J5TH94_HOMAM|nr:putative ryamide-like [Homarus americanus]